jgi:hypothetical protein
MRKLVLITCIILSFFISARSQTATPTPKVGFHEQKIETKNDPLAEDPEQRRNQQAERWRQDCDRLPETVALRGLRLGQNRDQVKTIVPSLRFKPQNLYGVQKAIFALKEGLPRPAALKGVLVLDVDFFEGRAYQISVSYESSTAWQTRDQFVDEIAGKFKLPPALKWSEMGDFRWFQCKSQGMIAGFMKDKYPFVLALDTSVVGKVSQRKTEAAYAVQEMIEEAKEKQRKAFKP